MDISQCLETASLVTTWEGRYWHLVGRGHEFYKGVLLKQNNFIPGVNHDNVEKCYNVVLHCMSFTQFVLVDGQNILYSKIPGCSKQSTKAINATSVQHLPLPPLFSFFSVRAGTGSYLMEIILPPLFKTFFYLFNV